MKIYRSTEAIGNEYCETEYAGQRALGDGAITKIASALGATAIESLGYSGNRYDVTLSDGVRLYVQFDGKGKVSVSGDYSKCGSAIYFRNSVDDEGTMSVSRGAAKVAADIMRRVVPGVIANMKARAESFEAETAAARVRDTNAELVAKVIGFKPAGNMFGQALGKNDTSHVRVPTHFGPYGNFQFYPGSDTCKIELSSVPIDTAVAIAMLLKLRASKEKEVA